jgi:response regulator RpfG family c-di-GMP phosphodiesterase
MLKHSERDILKAAAIISHDHHEYWNGEGYPRGLKEEEIHIFGRITAIADVYDALGHDRVYKKAWPIEKIIALFEEEKGKQFDPVLATLFLKHVDKFEATKWNLEGTVGQNT